jgi:hypothetical protein
LIIEATRKNLPVDEFITTQEDREKIELLSRNMTRGKVAMPSAAREYLAQYFAQDMKALREFVDFDITDWK